MSLKSQIPKTIASSWLSLAVVMMCQLIMIPLALSALSKVDFALYAVITQMMIAIKLAELGVRSACSRLLIDARAAGTEKYNKVWVASVCVFCIQASIMLLLMLVLAPFLESLFNLPPEQRDVARSIFIFVGILNSLGYILSIFSTALYAGQRLTYVNIISSFTAILQVVVFAISINMGCQLWSYPISMCAVILITNIFHVRCVLKHGLLGKGGIGLLDWVEVKVVLMLGMDVFVAGIFSVVMGNSLLLFSGHLLTLEQTAILAVNLKLVNMLTNILQRIPGSASPMLMKMVSEGHNDRFKIWWKFLTKSTIALALFCSGMFVIWNKLVVTLWTSESMVMETGAVILLSLIPFRYITHYQFVYSLAVFKEIRKVKWMLVWEMILYIVLAVVLGNMFGLMGLLSANLLSMPGGALRAGMKWIAHYAGFSIKELLSVFGKISIPLVTAFTLILLVGGYIQEDQYTSVLVMTTLWIVLFGLVSYYIIYDKSERQQMILGAIRKKL